MATLDGIQKATDKYVCYQYWSKLILKTAKVFCKNTIGFSKIVLILSKQLVIRMVNVIFTVSFEFNLRFFLSMNVRCR